MGRMKHTTAPPKKTMDKDAPPKTTDEDAPPKKIKEKTTDEGVKKKKRRYHPGTRAILDVRRYQKSTELLIRSLPFNRIIREIADRELNNMNHKETMRFQADAIKALQEGAEAYMIQLFSNANFLAIHSGRQTIDPVDLQIAKQIPITLY